MTDLRLLAALACGALLLAFALYRGRPRRHLTGSKSIDCEWVPFLVWTCQADGSFDYLSPQWIAYTGVPEAKQLGRGWIERLHPDDVARIQAAWAQALDRAEPFDTEFRIRRHDGQYRWFKTRAVPTPAQPGRRSTWVGTSADIQDIKERDHDRRTTLAVQLQIAQRVANVGSWDFDIASGQVVWSDELYRTFGMEPNVTAPAYSEQARLFDEESWTRLTAAVSHSVETGVGYELMLTAIRSDGERRATVARAEAMRGASGKVERLVGTFQDITARERSVAERKALSERLQLATSAARIGVWELDIPQNRLNWDPSMRRIYGYDQPDFEPSYELWKSVLHPEDREAVEHVLRDGLAGRGQFRALFRILRPSGEVRHVHAEAVLTRDALGRAQNMTGVNWDVTEQRVAELSLRSAEAMQRAILSCAGSAIIMTDSGTRLISSFNRAAEQLLGYTADEVIGKVTPELFHDPDELLARRRVGSTDQRGEPDPNLFLRSLQARSESREWTFIRKDGARIPVLLTMSAIRDSAQQVIGYLAVAADLSMRKQYEAELLSLNTLLEERTTQAESASYAKGMFLANMSHEIRSPIGAITGASYLLGRTTLSADQQDLLSTIDRSSSVLLSMVNDVLDLSKIEAQQLTLEHERFELPALLDDLASLMHAYASGRSLELILDIEPKLPSHFFGDRLRLTQVLTNLAVNAIKFTERGSVRVLARAVDSNASRTRLRFEVHDTGPGIEEGLQARLFKPFSQAEQTGPRRSGGTGLGLAIVRELVTLMEGSVGLSSRLGEGTTFWCEIALAHAPESVRPGAIGAELRALIIEDHAAQRAALLRCAGELGFRAVTAPSGEQGLQLLLAAAQAQRPFDLALVDWHMPGMSGLSVLDQVRASEPLKNAQPAVILMTAYELAALQSDPLSRLADAILPKPIGPASLMQTALRVLTARTPERVSIPARRRPSPARQRLKGAHILVADDSEINRSIARRILELEGATISVVGDGAEAVRMVVSGDRALDVVLMDIQMPVEDGVSASARIRTDERFATLPILALTAGALASERDRALAAGMTDFITKPYAAEDLIARVLQYVGPHAAAPVAPTGALLSAADAQREWREAEGFAIAEARATLAGDARLFRMLVARLGEDLAENPLDRRPRELATCIAWLHKLSGSAGVLCATSLHRCARDAEITLHKGGETELVRVAARLHEEITCTRRGIAAIAGWNTKAPARPQQMPAGTEALTRFMQCVRERDLQAFSMFSQLESELALQLGAADCQRLQSAIQRLDFATAAEILRPAEQALTAARGSARQKM